MAVDTFFAYSGVYSDVKDALADYDAVHALHSKIGLIDAYDAAVVERKPDGKVKIVKKHETPTRVGGVLGGGVGLATGLVIALFPAAAIGGGLLIATGGGGAVLGALAGHAAAGMSRSDLKELGEGLDDGQAGGSQGHGIGFAAGQHPVALERGPGGHGGWCPFRITAQGLDEILFKWVLVRIPLNRLRDKSRLQDTVLSVLR